MLPTLVLKRLKDKKHIINANGIWGKLYDCKGSFICCTLERPDLNNQKSISCIPAGYYKCPRDKTGKHQYWVILGVPNRTSIEIHIANYVDQLEGCIGLGESWSIMKNNIAITNSRVTLDRLLERFPEGFNLVIIDET